MRAFAWFGAVIVLGLGLSALIAYPLYTVVAEVGDWPFHRVASRIAMLVVGLELLWLCRRLDIRTQSAWGYGLPWRRFLSVSAAWGLAGILTAALGALFLLRSGLRVAAQDFTATPAALARVALVSLGSGIAVALLEESVMRGAMHTAIERESGPWAAALLTAPLFAILHFFAKARIPPELLGWGSGVDLLLRSFVPLSHPGLVLDAFLSWLVVGLILSLTRVLTGNIAVAIGLHAGWVFVLRALQQSTVRSTSSAYAEWVGRFDGLLGYWLLPWGLGIAAALWLLRARWVPAARSLPG
jgi:membrane protease YdiL (CAAX protease family)